MRHPSPLANMTAVAFSPDGGHIVTGSYDATVRVWDAGTGEEVKILRGHEGYVWSAVFSPDGERIVTGSYDNTARIWDVGTGEEIVVLSGHSGEVWSAAFGPDGKQVVTGSKDETARIWNAPFTSTDDVADYALSVIPRCLTSDQRKMFFLAPDPRADKEPLYCK